MKKKNNRDEFDKRVTNSLAKRASFICSNPDCRALTLCPSNTDSESHIYVGKAAHITAAAPNGPRYDPTLTPEQRSSSENGIFLCAVCAEKIDKNKGADYSVDQLKKWKSDHEALVRKNLNKSVTSLLSDPRIPELDLIFDSGSRQVQILKSHEIKDYEEHVKAELGIRIIRLDLQVVNKGTSPASDIDGILDSDGSFHIHTAKGLRNYWEIFPKNIFDDPKEFLEAVLGRRTVPTINRLHTDVLNHLSYSVFEGVIGSYRVLPKNAISRAAQVLVNGRRVTFYIRRLKQNLSQIIESFYIEFSSWEEMKSFTIQYTLNAEELPSDVTGSLSVEIQKEIIDSPLKRPKQKKRRS